jgi:hypothetical protein
MRPTGCLDAMEMTICQGKFGLSIAFIPIQALIACTHSGWHIFPSRAT